MELIVEDIKIGESEGGMACGPCGGSLIVSIKINDGEKVQYFTSSLFAGLYEFYLTDKDVFDLFIEEDFDNKAFTNVLENNNVDHLYDLDFSECESEYDNILELIHKSKNNPASGIMQLAVSLYEYLDEEEIKKYIGKNASEIYLL